MLAGDAARVVEPFTGEGIFYAMASGELAARFIKEAIQTGDMRTLKHYAPAHRRLYHRRLWANRLAQAAVLHPQIASILFSVGGKYPALLRFLTRKVVGMTAG